MLGPPPLRARSVASAIAACTAKKSMTIYGDTGHAKSFSAVGDIFEGD